MFISVFVSVFEYVVVSVFVSNMRKRVMVCDVRYGDGSIGET